MNFFYKLLLSILLLNFLNCTSFFYYPKKTEYMTPETLGLKKQEEFLKTKNISILIVDKSLKQLLDLADKFYIIEKGKTVWEGFSQNLTSQIAQKYLGV